MGQGFGAVLHQYVGGCGIQRSGQLFTDHGGQPLPYCRFDEFVAIGGRAAQGAERHARPGLTRVEGEPGDGHVGGAVLGQHGYIGEQGKKRQGNQDVSG